ncbi:2-oxoacid:acceptor oxidoreductase subunit alpha [Egibacter rhizosphaerae]|uniref:2-oxoacid:acceptor oxidoreductase subunit alpha n=1 Tax=Egibacter rhizosphaerae TaxID=1670831 RepID=A0A411YAH8_9ACTN|nr:2-oxoacid:acceptor oxidoreductase subunit alpha [Egibacter rhizosphaerae]QBI18223.1 2-oxoacid:acceptor oxidoreductase subunit alpha [Egibacter rhizosphaerae]
MTTKPVERVDTVTVRFAGDSGDGMQLAGTRFTSVTTALGNDVATLPDFPAEIRAPAGSLPGVSGFQLHFADHDILTPGDSPDVLVAMNPAALKTNLGDLERGATLVLNTDAFTPQNLRKARYESDPREDGTLDGFKVHEVSITTLTIGALEGYAELGKKEKQRAKNMFALGLMSWMFSRPTEPTREWLREKFGEQPRVAEANIAAFDAGWAYGETTEAFDHAYEVAAAELPPGTYRQITGNLAISYGLVAASQQAGLPLFLGGYPITPASDVLHELSKHKNFGVRTFQGEDEIASVGAALGAAFSGHLAATVTSGPGVALKTETIGLAVAVELPLLVLNIQRGGPSTGLPTKTEQADLLQALHGRNGESPVPVIAASTPGDCFDVAIEGARMALTYRTPVFVLSDGYLANGAEPWRVPDVAALPDLRGAVRFAVAAGANGENAEHGFAPFDRDPDTLARPWAIPGTPGLEHRIGGLEKADGSGDISYDPDNHHRMTELRQAKVDRIAGDIPAAEVDRADPGARVLVVGWGSSYGPIAAAVRACRAEGLAVDQLHLRHLNPFPPNLGEVLRRYERVLVPEMNMGQLRSLLRARFLVDARGYNRVAGLPFGTGELRDAIADEVAAAEGRGEPERSLS